MKTDCWPAYWGNISPAQARHAVIQIQPFGTSAILREHSTSDSPLLAPYRGGRSIRCL